MIDINEVSPMVIGDTLPSLKFQIMDKNRIPPPNWDFGIWDLLMTNMDTGSQKIGQGPISIVNVDAGVLRYDWALLDTNTFGTYRISLRCVIAGKSFTLDPIYIRFVYP